MWVWVSCVDFNRQQKFTECYRGEDECSGTSGWMGAGWVWRVGVWGGVGGSGLVQCAECTEWQSVCVCVCVCVDFNRQKFTEGYRGMSEC